MGNLFQELRRRNVFRVSTAYLVLGWLIIEVTDTVFPQFEFPLWTNQFVTLLVILGFPIAVFFAWAFEITPDGIKRESDVNREDSITTHTGRKLNFLIISILVIALGYFVYESRYAEDSVIDDLQIAEAVTDKSIAVLPFIDLSPDRSEAWFSDGLTAEILNNLTQLPELMVSARTSSFQFRGENRSIPEIAMRLGVTYVVEGSVRRLGDQLRITAQLIRADDGFNLWSETYNNSTEELFDVQEDVAEKIASALDVFLDDERREMMFQNGTRNIEAFEAYLKGVDIYIKLHDLSTNQTLWDANEFLAQAMELDPSFADPFIMHSDAFAHVVMDGNASDFVRVDGEARYSPEQAMDILLADLDYAAANARNSTTQLVAELDREFFSPTWC